MLHRLSALIVAVVILGFGWVALADRSDTYAEGWLAGAGVEGSLWTTATHRLDATVNQPLVAINWLGELQPLLAESWEMLEGGRVWILHLRRGVKWHDGTPFTSEDVVFSFNAYANPKAAARWATKVKDILGYDEFQAGISNSLSGVTAIDEYTVRIELKEAMPLWLKLAQTYIVILPKHILGAVPADQWRGHPYWKNRIGTGPFKWVEYVPDRYILLERNEEYFLGAPKIKYLVYRFYTDATSHLAALERGEIDTIAYETTLIGLDEVSRIDQLPGIDVVVMDKGMPNFLSVNHARPEWSDVRVRQAIRYAIDVNAIIENVHFGNARPAYTIFPQAWAIPDDLNTYPYDPDKARQLLAEAGYKFDRKIELIYHYKDPVTHRALLAIQYYLSQVGINVTLRLVEPAEILVLRETGNWDIGYFGHGMGLDPALGAPLMTRGAPEASGYANEEAERLFTEGLKYTTIQERQPIYHAIARIANQELPHIWLWYDPRPLAFNRRVWGPYEHWSEQRIIYFNMPVYQRIEQWYIKD